MSTRADRLREVRRQIRAGPLEIETEADERIVPVAQRSLTNEKHTDDGDHELESFSTAKDNARRPRIKKSGSRNTGTRPS
jgi:hypothetical protein